MGESLMERRRVGDEWLRPVNPCHLRPMSRIEYLRGLMVAEEEGTANSVPAAAVIQRSQALFGFTGRKGFVGGWVSLM